MPSQIPQNSKGMVLVIQIINMALIMGVLMFLGVAFFLTQDQQPKEPKTTYIALGFLAMGIAVSVVFRMPINRQRLSQLTPEQTFNPHSEEAFLALAPIYQTERIIKLAIIEGGALFSIVAYMIEKVWWSLAAVGVAVFFMTLGFPTRSTISAWIERRTLGLQFGDSEI